VPVFLCICKLGLMVARESCVLSSRLRGILGGGKGVEYSLHIWLGGTRTMPLVTFKQPLDREGIRPCARVLRIGNDSLLR
jgi:hypothetical protein